MTDQGPKLIKVGVLLYVACVFPPFDLYYSSMILFVDELDMTSQLLPVS